MLNLPFGVMNNPTYLPDVVVGVQGTGLVGLVDGSHLGWKTMSNDVVVGVQGTGLVGLVDGSHLARPPHRRRRT